MLVLHCLAVLYRMAGDYLLPVNKTRKQKSGMSEILGIPLNFSLPKVQFRLF